MVNEKQATNEQKQSIKDEDGERGGVVAVRGYRVDVVDRYRSFRADGSDKCIGVQDGN